MKKIIYITCFVISIFNTFAQDNRWSEEKANNWYKSFSWFTGVNYIPSDAINYTAMWDKTGFNPALINKELAIAQSIGFNCVRVVLQYAVYADDPSYFINTLDCFLDICDKHGIKVMPAFFDDCAFGVNADPIIGKQVEPLEGWYAWAWSPSPGHTLVVDQRFHPLLENYVKDVMFKFRNDQRIFVWDLYNEPTNSNLGHRSLPLVKSVFAWAREINPIQPLTMDVWNDNKELNNIVYENADIISFYCYGKKEEMARYIHRLRQYSRPLICSEWMNRTTSSTVDDIMPLLKEKNVGSILWGLVNGKTQTHLPWGFRPEKLPYTGIWQHNLYHSDFKPYNVSEIEVIKRLNGVIKSGNPVFYGWYADPEGIIYDDTYWIYPTLSDAYEKQTFFDCFSSKDLVTWIKYASILDTSEVKWAKKAMWAPSVIRKGKKYYLFFGANDVHEGEIGGIGVAVSNRPEGPYKDLLGRPLINEIVNGAQPIDQFVFKDGNTYYMYYGGWQHCNIVKLNSDFTTLTSFSDGEIFKEVTPEGYVEGPFVFKKNKKYYFMWSEGGWTGPDYSVAYAIADSPFGPFKRIGKILQQDAAVATGAGHHSVIHIPNTDDYYIVYHRRPLNDTHGNHRVVCIDKMTFDKEGKILPVKITFEGVEPHIL
ncbi:Xylosidase/arabinosidase [termite gut metagenome]|uniref:Xylosidase/arabinosidase n=1 Tax=termite gut metagenome TaxID=433724 RepID=A0A5J4S8P0_9ZZZZ